jgi:hypothetical protein
MNNNLEDSLSVSGALLVKTFGQQQGVQNTFGQESSHVKSLEIRRALLQSLFQQVFSLTHSNNDAVAVIVSELWNGNCNLRCSGVALHERESDYWNNHGVCGLRRKNIRVSCSGNENDSLFLAP